MKKILYSALGAVAIGAAALSLALAQVIVLPQVTAIQSTDLFQDIAGGQPQAQNYYAPAALLGNYGASLPGNNPENAIIGGDATTNLFQRATTGSSVTTTITYGGPDRWAYWSGASTAMTVSQDSTAADISPAYKYGFKMARTSGQTGVVQVCMMQEVESVNSYAFQGQTAELDFHATAGSNFSGASSQMTAYIITGTGADEGVSKAAFNLNGGGGGSSTWAGQVNTGVAVTISTVNTRYTVAVPAPASVTEIAVALCWTPVGTAGTNDYIAFSGIQLVRNNALTSAAGTAGAVLNPNDTRAKAFARRQVQTEIALQQRYFYSVTEPAASVTVGNGQASTTSTCFLSIPFPETMRIAPTFANFGTALSASTWKLRSAGTDYVLASTWLVVTTANTVQAGNLTGTMAASLTAGNGCQLVGAAGGSIITWSAEL